MAKTTNIERVLHGSMLSGIVWVAVPLMLNNLIQTLYNLADAWWVGRLGPEQFAATSFVWPILFLFISIGLGVAMAGTSILSQLIGADNDEEAESYTTTIYALAFLFSVVVTVVGYMMTPRMIGWMGATGNLAKYSTEYLRILFLGMPLQFIYFSTNAVFQSQGVTVLTTVLSALSTALNMVLNPLFIFSVIPMTSIKGLGMGVAGAAWATVLSQGVLVVVGFWFLRTRSPRIRVRWSTFRWDWNKIHLLTKVGIPSMIGQSGAALGFIIMNGVITAFGTDTLAAFSLVNRVSGIAMLPAMGIGSSMTIVVGQNIGNNSFDRAKKAMNLGFLLSTVVTVILSIPVMIFSREILQFFLPLADDSPILSLALRFLVFALILNPFMAFFSVLQGFFQGTGHTKYSMFMEVVRLWGIRLPIVFVLQYLNLWTQDGIWYAMIASNFLVVVIGLAIVGSGKWRKRVIGKESIEYSFKE